MNIFFIFLAGSKVLGQVFETTPFPQVVTSFTCHGRPPGYYADLETGCKTYHVCDGNSHFTYVCPKRTLFQQRSRICDHSYLVRCEDSPNFYETETVYPYDDDNSDNRREEEEEEEILFRLNESEENIFNKDVLEDDYNQTEEYIPTGTTPYELKEIQTTAIAITPETTIQNARPELTLNSNKPIEKFIKFRLKDPRSLFYIPEFDNNSVIGQPEREFLLPLEKNDLMRFRYRKKLRGLFSLCPSNCDPKFFLPGFCHPCIMIK